MYGAISSVNQRTLGESYLNFKVDEASLKPSSDRVVSKIETLDGNVVVTDWGYAEGRKTIVLVIDVTFDEYETLIDFQEDNINSFLFHYKNDSYAVIVRSVEKGAFYGDVIRTTVRMDVVQKLNGDGEYTG